MCLKCTGECSYIVYFQCINKGAHNAQEDSLGNVTFQRVLRFGTAAEHLACLGLLLSYGLCVLVVT